MQPLLLLLPLPHPILRQHLHQPHHTPLLQLLLLLLPMLLLFPRMNMVPPKPLSKMSTGLLRHPFLMDMLHPSLHMGLQQVFEKQKQLTLSQE